MTTQPDTVTETRKSAANLIPAVLIAASGFAMFGLDQRWLGYLLLVAALASSFSACVTFSIT